MRHEITKIDPWPTAKIFAVIAFLCVIALFGFFALLSLFGSATSSITGGMHIGVGLGLMAILPIFYAVTTYFLTLIMCYLYNWLAPKIGGFSYHSHASQPE